MPENIDRCSQHPIEPLPGTAKPGNLTLALEHYTHWGHDILNGEAFGEPLTSQLKAYLKHHHASLQLIRKPGRAGQQRQYTNKRALYIAWSNPATNNGQPILEYLEIDHPADLLNLNLTAPQQNPQATTLNHHIMLICTHGKRDACCALYGRPLALELAAHRHDIWESSHTKGHRFAPSMIMLPTNHSYGRLNAKQIATTLDQANQGNLTTEGNRGRGTLDPATQTAELALAQHLQNQGETVPLTGITPTALETPNPTPETANPTPETTTRQLTLTTPTHGTRTWNIELTTEEHGPLAASCGDQPKITTGWTATNITPA